MLYTLHAKIQDGQRPPNMNIALLIPAYRPGRPLIELARGLAVEGVFAAMVIVDDGSGPDFTPVFAQLREIPFVEVVEHAVNLGKGAALKTGINHILCSKPSIAGIVTADADGQHHRDDVIKVARRLNTEGDALVMGARQFSQRNVPARSKFGNLLTRSAVRALVGHRLTDTQTGLRGLPARLLPGLLRLNSSGYELELDMLIACKHQAIRVVEEPIRTIYEEGNKSSHFDPILDSMRIYFVLLRFGMLSLATAVVDNAVFYAAWRAGGGVLASQVGGRAVAACFNYFLARRAVFLSRDSHASTLPRYLLLVACSGAVSYALIGFIDSTFAMGVIWAKLAAEGLLFLASFAIQRDFVFTRKTQATSAATDWDRYYKSTPPTAKLTRKYTTAVLIRALREFAKPAEGMRIVEIGGANSCFLDAIDAALHPSEYHVVDNNAYGLELLRARAKPNVLLHQGDVLRLNVPLKADAVFSVGLIEHFDVADTRRATEAHFPLAKPDGCVIISFPTPTWLYRVARAAAEFVGAWKFPDERPLEIAEVEGAVSRFGDIVFQKTLWPLVFTQHLLVVKLRPDGARR